MSKGKVAALVGPKKVEIKEFNLPEVQPGAVLLKVRRSNLCGSELHIWRWHHPVIKHAVLGHEMIGEIFELGEGVTTDYAGNPVSVGDKVVPAYYLTCLKCRSCLRGDFNLCQNAYAFWSQPPEKPPHFTGTFATHYYVQPNQYFYKVPDSVPDAVAAGANCGLSQVICGLDLAELRNGESVVIQGAGGLGLYAVAVAKEKGAKVIVIDKVKERLEQAKAFGADYVIDLNEFTTLESRSREVQKLTEGDGADVVLEVAGVPEALIDGVHMIRPGGRYISIGNVNVSKEFEVPVAPGLITRKCAKIIGVVRYNPWYLYRALKFLERNHARYPFDKLTDKEYGLEEVPEALQKAENRVVTRAAIVPNK
ncbi:zinc-binding dehydrogenase [Calderihabitans maritimus]|uniref:Zinc-binding alcohol dehydrogenase n=1 Tax=Calderihabitans maritimus TaxID=1246530 RepID=A0A1Z5HTZ0_9FIRM|nr:zinc-binding dehydrogenase [Calderihabitans maritimus]GAW92801.1 zinc-binding alcohol dehydrogenase [Calderihabitans maritimus]